MKRAREGEAEDDGGATPRAVEAAEEGEDEDATRAVYERVNAERAAIYGADARGEVSLKLECANNFKLRGARIGAVDAVAGRGEGVRESAMGVREK